MTTQLRRTFTRSVRATTLYIVVIGIAMMIVFPMFFLFSYSLMSDYESYSEWPKPIIPRISMQFRLVEVDEGEYLLQIFNRADQEYVPFGPEKITDSSDDLKKLSRFVKKYSNCSLSVEQLKDYIMQLKQSPMVSFTLRKGLLDNYKLFFRLYEGASMSVVRSISTALLTILISLSIGGTAGYAFARYVFKGKNILKLSVLFVRMFPPVAIAIPMIVILGNIGLYDRPMGLSLIYSINQISISIWITASIFMGIPVSLEEAALLFGTSRVGAFFRITLPLALPGLAACSMYSFIYSWNETINAIILTQFNPTLPVVVYQSLLGANSQVHLIAAGSIAQALPAIIFTLFIRRYILQMWGGVKV